MRSVLRELQGDVARHEDVGACLRSPGFWTVALYRFGSWSHRVRPRLLRLPLLAAYKGLVLPIQLVKAVEIPARTPIGSGLRIVRPYAIVIPLTARIGARCTLHHDVTLGLGPVPGVPQLGDDVILMPGARVLGGIHVGDRAIVGPNVVVTRDLPPGTVLASPPIRLETGMLQAAS